MKLSWEDIDEICHIYELLKGGNDEQNEDFYKEILSEYERRKRLKSMK